MRKEILPLLASYPTVSIYLMQNILAKKRKIRKAWCAKQQPDGFAFNLKLNIFHTGRENGFVEFTQKKKNSFTSKKTKLNSKKTQNLLHVRTT